MKSTMAVATVSLLLVIACSGQPEEKQAPAEVVEEVESGWTVVSADELSEAQLAQQRRGLDAVQAMAGSLMGELVTALDEDGPDGAIEVCSMRAPEIAAVVSNEYGVVLGRTSHRLRNSSNLPPEWAANLVRDNVAEPTWLVGPEGRLAGLLPIQTKAECGMCHGPREELADEVIAKLDEYYPDDEAVGFSEGDLRGWIWVEAPTS
jgi:hypothetical protein